MLKLFCICTLLLAAFTTEAQQRHSNPNAIVDTFKKSIPCIAKGKIGTASAEIKYYSPGLKNRIIWGGLVPYDNVWVTGAHSATSLTITKDFKVGDKKIKAGTYALFTIPGKDSWVFILNKNYEQHLADEYKQEEDVVRVSVKPDATVKKLERLQYFIERNSIVIAWENLKIEVPFTTQ
jgi:Protein of unknown function (DUF2911)